MQALATFAGARLVLTKSSFSGGFGFGVDMEISSVAPSVPRSSSATNLEDILCGWMPLAEQDHLESNAGCM